MELKERLELIKINTQEIVTEEELKKLLKKKKKPVAYIGIAPTGPFHIGYLLQFTKLWQLQQAGIKCIVLLADIHASLDELKAPWEKAKLLADYTENCVKLALPWKEEPEIVRGSSFEFDRKYVEDTLRLASMISIKRATRAAREVCRMSKPRVSELLYPIMQSIDQEALGADISLAGIENRHAYMLGREYLKKLGYTSKVEVYTPLITGLKGPGVKMSSSKPETLIRVYDSDDKIRKRIAGAYCPVGETKDNPLLQICKYIIFKDKKSAITIKRPKKYGGDVHFHSYEDLENTFKEGKLHPADLKNSVADELITMLKPVRDYFSKNKSMLKKLGPNFYS